MGVLVSVVVIVPDLILLGRFRFLYDYMCSYCLSFFNFVLVFLILLTF